MVNTLRSALLCEMGRYQDAAIYIDTCQHLTDPDLHLVRGNLAAATGDLPAARLSYDLSRKLSGAWFVDLHEAATLYRFGKTGEADDLVGRLPEWSWIFDGPRRLFRHEHRFASVLKQQACAANPGYDWHLTRAFLPCIDLYLGQPL